MSKLKELVLYDTGLTYKGQHVQTGFAPTATGGNLVIQCGLKRRTIPLRQILSNVAEPAPEGTTAEDLVTLDKLEPRLAIMVMDADSDVNEKARYLAKCAVLALVREMRDERRAEAGLPKVKWKKGEDE